MKEEIRYIRAKYLRGFIYQYPDIDANTIIRVNITNLDSPDKHDLIAYALTHNNRNSFDGRWYVIPKYRGQIFNTQEECENATPLDRRSYIRFRYRDTFKYSYNCKRYVEVTDKEYQKYCPNGRPGNRICIESNSNPLGYEEAIIISSIRSEFPPAELLNRKILGTVQEVIGPDHSSIYKRLYELEQSKNEHLSYLYNQEKETTELLRSEIVELCEDFVQQEENRGPRVLEKIKSGDIVSAYKDLTFAEAVCIIDAMLALSTTLLTTSDQIEEYKSKLVSLVEAYLLTGKFSELNLVKQKLREYKK